jgi:hypothetical protein
MQPPISSTSAFPLHELGEYAFQELCRDLFDEEPGIAICEVYGLRGQSQDGIELIAHRKIGSEIEVGQCKCYRTYTGAKIEKASDEFLQNRKRWSEDGVKRFILFVGCNLDDRQCQDQILKEKKRFAEFGITYEAWSSARIRNKLRPYPAIVRSHFTTNPDYWVSVICGIAPQAPVTIVTPSQTSLIVSAAFAQSERLATRLSSDMRQTGSGQDNA